MNTEIYCSPGMAAYEAPVVALSSGDTWKIWQQQLNGSLSDSGVQVNGVTALGNCNVWKAINTLAGDVGQLPIKLFQKTGRQRKEITGVPEIDVLQVRPNGWQTASVWKETEMWWALLWGNGCSWIRRNNAGRIVQLVPLRPDRLTYHCDDDMTGSFYYTYTTKTGAQVDFDAEEIFHIKGLAGDGIWGISLLDIAKNCIGHGLAMEKHANSLFANGAMPGVILRHPGKISPEASRNLRTEWNELHAGPRNAGRTAVLQEAMEAQVLSMTNRDAELSVLRKMDQVSVANLFGLPLFKLNSMEDSSVRANLEEQNRDYFNTSLSRWLNRFAEEAARKLLSDEQLADGFYYKWVPEAFLKGDIEKRYRAYGAGISSLIISPNEAREKEDMDPYDGGDEYSNPAIDTRQSAETQDQNTTSKDVSTASERLVQDNIRAVALKDINAVLRAAQGAANFVQWIDTRYGEGGGFDQSFADIVVPALDLIDAVGVVVKDDPKQWQACWRVESKRRLLKLCDQTTSERLTASVKEELETWKARI